jgi:hypothetical protein
LKSFILGEFIILFSNDAKKNGNDDDDDDNNNNNNDNCDGVYNNDDLIAKDLDDIHHTSQFNTTAEISNVSIDDSDTMEAQINKNNDNNNNHNNNDSSNKNSKSRSNTFHVSRSSDPSIQSIWEGTVVIYCLIMMQAQLSFFIIIITINNAIITILSMIIIFINIIFIIMSAPNIIACQYRFLSLLLTDFLLRTKILCSNYSN